MAGKTPHILKILGSVAKDCRDVITRNSQLTKKHLISITKARTGGLV